MARSKTTSECEMIPEISITCNSVPILLNKQLLCEATGVVVKLDCFFFYDKVEILTVTVKFYYLFQRSQSLHVNNRSQCIT